MKINRLVVFNLRSEYLVYSWFFKKKTTNIFFWSWYSRIYCNTLHSWEEQIFENIYEKIGKLTQILYQAIVRLFIHEEFHLIHAHLSKRIIQSILIKIYYWCIYMYIISKSSCYGHITQVHVQSTYLKSSVLPIAQVCYWG